MKIFFLINMIFISSAVLAGDWYSLGKIKEYMSPKKSCSFSAVRLNVPTSSDRKQALGSLGWKKGDVEKWTRYTPILCIYNGTIGRGIKKQKGCIAGIYAIDKDQYLPIRFNSPSGRGRMRQVLEKGKNCSKEVITNLLTKRDFSRRVMIPEALSFKLWESYVKNADWYEQEIHILNDRFNLKDDLMKNAKQILNKVQEKMKKAESKRKKQAREDNKNKKQMNAEIEKQNKELTKKKKEESKRKKDFENMFN